MKMIARMITTAAIAIFLMPAILPRTGEAQAVMAAVVNLTSTTGWIIPVDGGKLVG